MSNVRPTMRGNEMQQQTQPEAVDDVEQATTCSPALHLSVGERDEDMVDGDGNAGIVVTDDSKPVQAAWDDDDDDDEPGRSENDNRHPSVDMDCSTKNRNVFRQRRRGRGQRARQQKDESVIYTRVPPPGWKAFGSWLNRAEATRVDAADDGAIKNFMGPLSHTLEEELRRKQRERQRRESAMIEEQEQQRKNGDVSKSQTGGGGSGSRYETVNYDLYDMPVWHRRKLAYVEQREMSERYRPSYALPRVPRPAYSREGVLRRLARKRQLAIRTVIVLIGTVLAFVGLAISKSAERLVDAKIELATRMGEATADGYLPYIGLSILLAFGAFLPVAFRPVAAGSGIAEAKATLNGIIIADCTALLTALCKGISVVFASAAGLPVGLEGPMIHVGLAVGENSYRAIPNVTSFDSLKTDRTRRDLAAVGTAAGVATAFLSPIGGVLFAMEEGSSFWSTLLTWRCFAAACTCVITRYFVVSWQNGFDRFSITDLATFSGLNSSQVIDQFHHPTFDFVSYFLFLLFGIVGGLVGAVFCELNRKLTLIRRRLNFSKFWKGVEVVVLAAIMSTLTWWLPTALKVCTSLDKTRANHINFRQFGCEEGHYNELASLFLNPTSGVGIDLLFHEPADAFTAKTCAVAGLVYLLMLLVVFGSSISSGIFIPLLYSGACFGRAAVVALQIHGGATFEKLDVTTFSIVGATAMLAGVVRVLISLTVIMMEATALTYLVTPLMVVTMAARTVGNGVFGRKGIYDIILTLKGMPFLEEQTPNMAQQVSLRARDIMSPTADVTLPAIVSVEDLLTTLRGTSPYSTVDFPVVDPLHGGALVGVISRSYLLTLLMYPGIFHQTANVNDPENGIAVPSEGESKAITYHQLAKDYPKTPSLDEVEGVLAKEEHISSMYIDLTPYIQIAPHTFDGHGSAERAYEMFRTLGLRYIIILDRNSRPTGIITREDLVLLEEIGVEEEEDMLFRRTNTEDLSYDNVS